MLIVASLVLIDRYHDVLIGIVGMFVVIFSVLSLLSMPPQYRVLVKRLHDRGQVGTLCLADLWLIDDRIVS